jgi:hypothetical protein
VAEDLGSVFRPLPDAVDPLPEHARHRDEEQHAAHEDDRDGNGIIRKVPELDVERPGTERKR